MFVFCFILGNFCSSVHAFLNKMFACLQYSQSTHDPPVPWISTNHNPYQNPRDNLIPFNTCHHFQFFNQHLCFFRSAFYIHYWMLNITHLFKGLLNPCFLWMTCLSSNFPSLWFDPVMIWNVVGVCYSKETAVTVYSQLPFCFGIQLQFQLWFANLQKKHFCWISSNYQTKFGTEIQLCMSWCILYYLSKSQAWTDHSRMWWNFGTCLRKSRSALTEEGTPRSGQVRKWNCVTVRVSFVCRFFK